jgi:signal transduction histidine kinase
VSVDVENEVVSISIEDAGQGFVDASVVNRGISSKNSTGLGLDIARRTIEAASGSIFIGESESLGGASVLVRLPIAGP